MPRKFIAAADVEKFESAASAGAGGHVARGASGQQQTIADLRDGRVEIRSVAWGVHVGKFRGDNESVVAHQRAACGADSLLAVLC